MTVLPFISFPCLIAVARTSNTMLNISGESRQPWLLPDLNGKDFSFCPLSMMLAIGVSYMAFIMLSYAPCIPTLLSVFNINKCWIFFQMLFHLVLIWSCDFCLFFCLSDVLHLLICINNIIPSLIPWDESHLIMVYDLFDVLLDAVCPYFVEDFNIYIHQQYRPLVFFLCCVFVWFGDYNDAGPMKRNGESSLI